MGWIMGGGAKLLGILFGGVGFAALLLTTVTLGFDKWEATKAGLRGEGRMQCTADYEAAARKAEREKADAELKTANDLLAAERETSGGLRDELEKITGEYQELAANAAAKPSDDPSRCLSDSLLGKLRGASDPANVDGKPTGRGRFPGH